jgi:hypothetical protein
MKRQRTIACEPIDSSKDSITVYEGESQSAKPNERSRKVYYDQTLRDGILSSKSKHHRQSTEDKTFFSR